MATQAVGCRQEQVRVTGNCVIQSGYFHKIHLTGFHLLR